MDCRFLCFVITVVCTVACTTACGGGKGKSGGMPDAGGDGGTGLPPVSDLQPELLMASGLADIWGTSSADLFVVGPSGLIARHVADRWLPFDLPEEARDDQDILGVFGFANDNVYAVGERGVLLRFDGTQWLAEGVEGVRRTLYDVWGSSPTDVYASGDGVVLHYDGVTWEEVDTGLGAEWRGVSGSGPNDVLLAGELGYFNDADVGRFNGATWSSITPPAVSGNTYYVEVWSAHSSAAFFVGIPGRISFWNGASLTDMSSGVNTALVDVWGVSENEVFAVGGAGAFLRYNGSVWSSLVDVPANGTTEFVRAVYGFAGNDVYVAGNGVTHFDGANLSTILAGEGQITGLWESGGDNVLILGGDTFRYDGATAVQEDFGGLVVPTLTAAWGPPDHIVAVSTEGSAFLYDGSSWGAMTTNNNASLNDVWGSSEQDVFAVGRSGTILHFNGSAWGGMASGTDADLRSVWGTARDNVYAVGADGTIVHFDGVSWATQTSGTDAFLSDIFGFDASHIYVVTGESLLLGDGVTWTFTPIKIDGNVQRVFSAAGTAPNDLFITVFDEELRFGHFDGTTFTRLPAIAEATDIAVVGPRDVFATSVGSGRYVYRYRVP